MTPSADPRLQPLRQAPDPNTACHKVRFSAVRDAVCSFLIQNPPAQVLDGMEAVYGEDALLPSPRQLPMLAGVVQRHLYDCDERIVRGEVEDWDTSRQSSERDAEVVASVEAQRREYVEASQPLPDARLQRSEGPAIEDKRLRRSRRSQGCLDNAGQDVTNMVLSRSGSPIDFPYISNGYRAPTSQAAKRRTLEFAWAPYYTRASLPYRQIDRLIVPDAHIWNACTEPSRYLFWTGGMGSGLGGAGSYRTLVHALRLLYAYRRLVPQRQSVRGAERDVTGFRDDVIGALESRDLLFVSAAVVDLEPLPTFGSELPDGCYATGRIDDVLTGLSLPQSPAMITYHSNTSSGTSSAMPERISRPRFGWSGRAGARDLWIDICPNFLDAQSFLADAFLFYAHRAFWFAVEGVDATYPNMGPHFREILKTSLLYKVWLLGRLSLGAISEVSRIIVHEYLHKFRPIDGDIDHCHLNCAFTRMSLKFACRLFSELALLSARYGGINDTANFVDQQLVQTTSCDSSLTDYDIFQYATAGITLSNEFAGGCSFLTPGIPGNANNWTAFNPRSSLLFRRPSQNTDVRWQSPSDCPPS